jgi:hypothetical protein
MKDDFLATISHGCIALHEHQATSRRCAAPATPCRKKAASSSLRQTVPANGCHLIEDLLFTSGVETQDPGNRLGPVGLAG